MIVFECTFSESKTSLIRWDGSTSVHTAVMGECLEGEVFRYLVHNLFFMLLLMIMMAGDVDDDVVVVEF